MKVKNLLELECSFFPHTYSKPEGTVKVSALFDHSLSDYQTERKISSKQMDDRLYKLVKKSGKTQEYEKKKAYQVAVTPSGIFGERRSYEYLEESNPLVVVDIDGVKADKKYLESFKKYPWIVGAGQSVSRQGVFLLVYIENPTLIKEHFLALRQIFTESDDLKDTTRLRYISYGLSWVRKGSETIEPYKDTVAIPIDDIYETKQHAPTDKYDSIEYIQEALGLVGSIEESGGLHPWTVRIAARCNRKGISLTFAMTEVWKKIKRLPIIEETARYTNERFKKDFVSVYTLYKHEHHLQTKVKISKSKMSRFNNSIYERSPKVLQDLVGLVDQKEEKEVVFFTAIILLGVLFPNRCFRYFNNGYYPNLYGYILGEAASFKGKAKIVRTALKPYQQRVDDEYKGAQEQKAAAIAYNKENKENKQEINKVPDLNFFFDGNTSSAAMLKAMQDSPVLVMFETEGDTITKTWRTDWGNYSDILRKTFEHESLYSLKKNGNDENLLRIHIQNPKLSVLVSSTENQMRKVLNSDETENGLMSRFLFYIVQNDKTWYNGWESNTDLDIESILKDRLPPEIWRAWTTQPDIFYTLSKEAYQYHQDYFNHVNDNWPDELFNIIALIRRSGTACARIAMIIEELHALDAPAKSSGIVARQHTISGESMLLAIDIMKILMQHLFVAWQITYKETDDKETNVQASSTRDAVENALKNNPDYGVRKIAKELGIGKTTAQFHIKNIKNRTSEDGH